MKVYVQWIQWEHQSHAFMLGIYSTRSKKYLVNWINRLALAHGNKLTDDHKPRYSQCPGLCIETVDPETNQRWMITEHNVADISEDYFGNGVMIKE